MADIHLKIDGIDGESSTKGYEKQIDCQSWGWGASQVANMHVSTGGAAGGSSVQDLQVYKSMDKASPNLMLYCCKGTHIPEVVLTCTKSGDDQIRWMVLTMKKVIISSVGPSGSEGSMGTESLTLNFAEYKMEYFPQEAKGGEGAAVTAAYDIAAQTQK